MKKLISLAIILCMVLSLLAGCGDSGDDGSAVTLKWALGVGEQSDYPEVLTEVNKELEKLLPNTKLEFILDSQMGSKWSLWMAGGTAIDIAHSGYSTELYSEISKHSYMGLNELIEEYAPNIVAAREKYAIEYAGGTYNNELYAIPNVQYHVRNTLYINIPNELGAHFDVDALVAETKNNRKTTAKLYDILDDYFQKVYSKKLVDNDTISGIIDINRMYDLAKRGYDFIGGADSNLCYDVDDESCKIIDFHTTEEFKTFIKYAQKWYKAGYISKDILTGAGSGSRLYVLQVTVGNRALLETENTYVVEDDKSIVATGVDRLYIQVNQEANDYLGASELGKISTYTSIPSTAKNPIRAIKLINILHSEEGRDLMNLICYGFEGKHYDVVEENVISPREYATQGSSSSSYGIPNWMVGNIFFADVCYPAYDMDYVKAAEEYYANREETTQKTKLYKFSANIDSVANELSQLTAVNTEYETQLISGALNDIDSTYNAMLSKTKAAGQEKIIKELQTQVDKYIK